MPPHLGRRADVERYGNRFDPLTGTGVVEIRVPVTA